MNVVSLPSTWSGIIAYEDQPTGDGRLLEPNSLFWELDNPTALRHVAKDVGAHDGAASVGRFTKIERQDDGAIYAEGTFDLGSEAGVEAARLVRDEVTTGVSVDLDSVAMEIRVAKEVLDDMMDEPVEVEDPESEEDEDGMVTVIRINPDDELSVMTSARIRAATLVAIPAFAGATIAGGDNVDVDLDNLHSAPDTDEDDAPKSQEASLIASARPAQPPREWFRDPGLTEPTALHVTDDGRVYGHLAAWGTCHTAFANECLTPPQSQSAYAYFRTGSVLTDQGEVSTGRITMDTAHAGRTLSAAGTVSHYENTGSAVADVAAGEDVFGIWLAGAIRPGVTDEQVRALRASPLSGDWRKVKGGLELMAALAVNMPGFPIPRPAALAASGFEVESLVASGMLMPEDKGTAPESNLSSDDLATLSRMAADYRKVEEGRARERSLERVRRLASQLNDDAATSKVKRILIPSRGRK